MSSLATGGSISVGFPNVLTTLRRGGFFNVFTTLRRDEKPPRRSVVSTFIDSPALRFACLLVAVAGCSLPASAGETLPGELLYNGIRLPAVWPPVEPLTREPRPAPYLQQSPEVIPIDVGRQLLVDDFLVQETTSSGSSIGPSATPPIRCYGRINRGTSKARPRQPWSSATACGGIRRSSASACGTWVGCSARPATPNQPMAYTGKNPCWTSSREAAWCSRGPAIPARSGSTATKAIPSGATRCSRPRYIRKRSTGTSSCGHRPTAFIGRAPWRARRAAAIAARSSIIRSAASGC